MKSSDGKQHLGSALGTTSLPVASSPFLSPLFMSVCCSLAPRKFSYSQV